MPRTMGKSGQPGPRSTARVRSDRQLATFAEHAGLPFTLLSDQDEKLAAGLRLPTSRAAGVDRFKRTNLLVDPIGVVSAVQVR